MTRPTIMTAALALALVTGLPPSLAEGGDLHFGLSRSSPQDGEVVGSAEELVLWFTQEPQDGSLSIRLLDSAGDAVSTGGIVRDEDDPRMFSLSVKDELGVGPYSVAWRGMGADGHVVRDRFGFTVRP